MGKANKALESFEGAYNCSQSVITAYCEQYGIKKSDAARISAGFGGGLGRTQGVCGAISGAVMVIGCRYYDESNASETKDLVYSKTKELIENFKKLNMHTDCFTLTGVDFSKEGWIDEYNINMVRENKCSRYIKDVCGILDKLI